MRKPAAGVTSRMRGMSCLLGTAAAIVSGNYAVASDVSVQAFASAEGTSSAYITLGAKIGPGRLNESSPLALMSGGGDLARIDGETIVLSLRRDVKTAALIGYQWMLSQGVIAGFVGPEAVYDRSLRKQDRFRGGARFQMEAWLRPTDETLFNAVAIVGTGRDEFWSRLSCGYRLWDVYVGPEISNSFDVTGYSKSAIGLHATDFGFVGLRWRVSAGLQRESRLSSAAPYLSLAAWVPL